MHSQSAEERSLKIAMLMREFSDNGGLELYALKLVEGLLARGHKVTVICQSNKTTFSHEHLRVVEFPQERASGKQSKSLLLDFYYAKSGELTKALGPFDIVHSQHLPTPNPDCVTFHNHTACRLSKVGYFWERLLNNAKLTFSAAYKSRRHYDGLLCRQAKMRIFVGAVMKDDFYEEYGLSDAPYAVAHPGASLSEVSAEPDGAETRNFANFLFVGKGFRKKGLDTLLAACKILKSEGLKFHLNIAGLRPNFWKQAELAALGLSKEVSYLGFRSDMQTVYSENGTIVLPSKIEPFGMAPVQGMQFGLVPIVSKISGVSEVLEDGVDALILKEHRNCRELASLMKQLIDDQALGKRLSAKALAKSKQVTWERTIDETQAAYSRLLAGQRGKA